MRVVNLSAFEFPSLPLPPPGQTLEPVPGRDYVSDELFVKFKETVEADKKNKMHEKLGSKKIKDFKFIKVDYVKLKQDMSVEDAIMLYSSDPEVEYAEPNIIYQLAAAPPPGNPYYTSQWNLTQINASGAWNTTTGRSDVVVGLIDSGINYQHEEFLNSNTDSFYNIWLNPGETNPATYPAEPNGLDNDQNDYVDDIIGINAEQSKTVIQNPMDTYGHGTHVAGIIGATPYNAKGIVGLNWNVKLLPCRFMNANNGEVITCIDYFIWAKTHGGANIVAINASWGGTNYIDYTGSKTLYDTIASTKDILFVAAAGNAGDTTHCANKTNPDNDQQPFYPASYSTHFVDTSRSPLTDQALLPNVISVTATDPSDQRGIGTWSSCNNVSNVSFESCYGRRSVHIGAPGMNILSTFPLVNRLSWDYL